MQNGLLREEKIILGKWMDVEPIHCHQRFAQNTLVTRLRVVTEDKVNAELYMKFNPEELIFFFDHEIDHLPGMLETCGLRQCALALAHLVYDVPMEYVIVMDWINIKLYNYGELNTETIVKSKLVDLKKDKNKISLVLEGLMIQKDYPTMRMTGSMIAFNPAFAKRLRYKKTYLENMKEKPQVPLKNMIN